MRASPALWCLVRFGPACLLAACSAEPEPDAPLPLEVAEQPACSASARQPFVLTRDGTLLSFDPAKRSFSRIARVSCWAPGMVVNSMAIDARGVAWINFIEWDFDDYLVGGAVYRASTIDGTCVATDVVLPSDWYRVGMTFSLEPEAPHHETMFVAAGPVEANCIFPVEHTGAGLAVVDTASGVLTPLGPFPEELGTASPFVTSNADGELFAFFSVRPPVLARIDKTTGAISDMQTLEGLECPGTFAFAFWEGDLYLFTAPAFDAGSSVTRYSLADGTLDVNYVSNVGFNIVGAGVSSCAPGEP